MAPDVPPDSLAVLAGAFADRVASLKRLASLRCSDFSAHSEELKTLEATLDAVEADLNQIQSAIESEKAQFKQAEALTDAITSQKHHLDFISRQDLPRFLPASVVLPAEHKARVEANDAQPSVCQPLGKENHPAQPSCDAAAAAPETASASAAAAHKSPSCTAAVSQNSHAAPRRYITTAELHSLSAYMRGRLTLDKINAAVDDAAFLAEANAKLLVAVRGSSLSVADRQRGQMLQRNVAGREEVKGHHWFLEHDLKSGAVLKLDKTSKSILTILRHLGRLREVHCQVTMNESYDTVYVMI